ncbi:MAG: HIT family protein [Pseudomonadota bacterium]
MNCPLCEGQGAEPLWQDAFCRVIWVEDANYPGFCRVILNAHVREMTDLPVADRQRLMAVVFATEQAVREAVRPDKINLASLGNMVPHVHWHVIPRWADDVNFPDAIWAPARREAARFSPSPSMGEALKERVQLRLAALLG